VDLDGTTHLDLGNIANFGYFDKFSFSCWIKPAHIERGTILSRMEDVPEGSGYSIRLTDGKVEVDLVKRWLDDSIRVETRPPVVKANNWTHLAVTYDGTRLAAGIRVFVDGRPVPLKVNLDYINQSFNADDAPLRLGAGHGPQDRYRGQLDDVRIYSRALTAEEASLLSEPNTITEILRTTPATRTLRQTTKLRNWYLAAHAPDAIRAVFEERDKLARERTSFDESIPTVMVMQEQQQRRPTHILKRGEYDLPGEEVSPGVPASIDLSGTPIDDRLALARWLVDERNPLAARVAVNRLWQQLFGTGLVKTSEDFGSQGEQPSHPELLDWLATELIRLDWDVKGLQKLIVTSATYRQASKITPQLLERDPENRLLARGPRVRLSARMLRDQALFVSGLLHEQRHGPSVKPYQPEGLWKEIATTTEYEQSTGTDLYRRSLYTYWKRTVAPPSLALFDAAGREMCVVRSSRTNTPLQALALMNDVTYLEAARALAERTFREATGNTSDRINQAFLLATARLPDHEELKVLSNAHARHHNNYEQHPEEAEMLISHGASKPDPVLNRTDLAAMTVIAAMILNLDEVITKE
ncbi:MAG TPA: DUF1553 domain-containing protein, partial [Planctomycetaceae bacterium]|nr:DUF1553 domain-containing protein [Planctomycetaceae bacterium]